MTTRFLIIFFSLLIGNTSLFAQEKPEHSYILKENLSYISGNETDPYKRKRCMLDIYYPEGKKDFTTLIWFHGGGLEGGEKFIPEELKNKGICIVAPNYRLSPEAKNPAYTEDAAEAIAWVFNHISLYGGNPEDIYISGHSAGGYLALLAGFDKSYLQKYGIDANRIKGIIPVSGQTNTHYTIRKERNLPQDIPVVDEFAPINKIRKDVPPTLLISGDRKLEMTARYEENAHLEAVLKGIGAENVISYELEGFNHGNVYQPACYLILEWIRKYSR